MGVPVDDELKGYDCARSAARTNPKLRFSNVYQRRVNVLVRWGTLLVMHRATIGRSFSIVVHHKGTASCGEIMYMFVVKKNPSIKADLPTATASSTQSGVEGSSS